MSLGDAGPVRRVVRIAHRGGGSLAPENSLEGIELSIGYGVDIIEVDVRRCRDGALVLSHDDVLHMTGPRVSESTIDELRAADAHVTTLDEALKTARDRVRLNLDIKEPGIIDQVAETVGGLHAWDGCIVSCLDAGCLARLAQIEPSVSRYLSYPPDYGGASSKAWLTPAVNAVVAGMRATLPMRLPRMLGPSGGASATIYHKLITRRLVDTARRLGVDLFTWTVDDPAEMARVIGLGVDGITSNRPDLLAQLPGAHTGTAVAPQA